MPRAASRHQMAPLPVAARQGRLRFGGVPAGATTAPPTTAQPAWLSPSRAEWRRHSARALTRPAMLPTPWCQAGDLNCTLARQAAARSAAAGSRRKAQMLDERKPAL
eukprot:6186074-Pleurochrysis_carterae.AAC.2